MSCPRCRCELANDESLAGQWVACPNCGQQFVMAVQQQPNPPVAVPAIAVDKRNSFPSNDSALSLSSPPSLRSDLAKRHRSIVTPVLVVISIALGVGIGAAITVKVIQSGQDPVVENVAHRSPNGAKRNTNEVSRPTKSAVNPKQIDSQPIASTASPPSQPESPNPTTSKSSTPMTPEPTISKAPEPETPKISLPPRCETDHARLVPSLDSVLADAEEIIDSSSEKDLTRFPLLDLAIANIVAGKLDNGRDLLDKFVKAVEKQGQMKFDTASPVAYSYAFLGDNKRAESVASRLDPLPSFLVRKRMAIANAAAGRKNEVLRIMRGLPDNEKLEAFCGCCRFADNWSDVQEYLKAISDVQGSEYTLSGIASPYAGSMAVTKDLNEALRYAESGPKIVPVEHLTSFMVEASCEIGERLAAKGLRQEADEVFSKVGSAVRGTTDNNISLLKKGELLYEIGSRQKRATGYGQVFIRTIVELEKGVPSDLNNVLLIETCVTQGLDALDALIQGSREVHHLTNVTYDLNVLQERYPQIANPKLRTHAAVRVAQLFAIVNKISEAQEVIKRDISDGEQDAARIRVAETLARYGLEKQAWEFLDEVKDDATRRVGNRKVATMLYANGFESETLKDKLDAFDSVLQSEVLVETALCLLRKKGRHMLIYERDFYADAKEDYPILGLKVQHSK